MTNRPTATRAGRVRRRPPLVALLVGCWLASIGALQPEAPTEPGLRLVVEAPPSLAPVAQRLQRFDTSRLAPVVALIGAPLSRTALPPIHVQLLSEDAPAARATPLWVAGLTLTQRHEIMLFPARIGNYPFGSLETVLYHEIAHVLVSRAAGQGLVPRWFHEGLASAAERTRGLEARSRLTWELLIGRRITATQLERLFDGDPSSVSRAYVLSDALVRDLLQRGGGSVPSRILRRIRDGEPFELALVHVTGLTVTELMAGFWDRHALWKRWVSVLGHPFATWIAITALAIVAIWRHRRRRIARRLEWEREDALVSPEDA